MECIAYEVAVEPSARKSITTMLFSQRKIAKFQSKEPYTMPENRVLNYQSYVEGVMLIFVFL